MLVYRAHGLRVGVVCLDEEPAAVRVDRLLFLQRATRIAHPDALEESHTLFLDLLQTPEQLLANMHQTTEYEIRRATSKDQIICEYPDPKTSGVMDEFYKYFDRFSSTMEYQMLDPFGRKWLEMLADAGQLDVAVAKDAEGKVLAYHLYFRGGKRIRLRHACTLHKLALDTATRALIGRANRRLFWSDILRFKEKGLEVLDFGGWYARDDNPQMLRINKFKEGFGGRVTPIYTCDRACTFKGKVAIWARGRLLAWRNRKRQ